MEGEVLVDASHSTVTHVNHKDTNRGNALSQEKHENSVSITMGGSGISNSQIHNSHDISVQLKQSAGGQKESEVSDANVNRASRWELSPNNASTGITSQLPGDNIIFNDNGPAVADDTLLGNSSGQAQLTLCGNEALNIASSDQDCSEEGLILADQTSHRMNESQYLACIPDLSTVLNEENENMVDLVANGRSYEDAQELHTLREQLQVISRETQDQIENSDVAVRMQQTEESSRGGSEPVPIVVASDDEVEIVCVKTNSLTSSLSQCTSIQSSTDKGEGLRDTELEYGETCVDLSQNVGHPGKKTKKKHKGGGSPTEQVCSICLDEFENKSFLDQCFHAFCYYCILQWAEVVKSCPLCKSSFSSVIHSVKSMSEYEQHFLPDSQPRGSSLSGYQSSQDARRFRYRTTVTQGSQLRSGRGSWEARVWGRETIMSARRNKELAAREARRAVYANETYVQGITQQGKPKYRNISPGFFRANPACTHRLVPWLTRELQVLLNDEPNHVEFVRRIVLTIINKVPIDSDEFADQIRPFLLDRTDHFIHEFASFARAPFDMSAYDARVQYNLPSRANRSDTPTVISHTSGWETPDFAPGPSTFSWDASPRSEAMQQQVNSSWSPPSTSAITISQRQGVIVVTQDQRRSHNYARGDAVSVLSRCSSSSDSVEYVGCKNGSWSDTARNDVTAGSDNAQRPHVRKRRGSTDESEVQARSRSRSRSRKRNHRHKNKHKHRHKHKHKHRSGHKYGENSRGIPLSKPPAETSSVDVVVLSSNSLSSEESSLDDAAGQNRVRKYKKHSHGHKNTKSLSVKRSPSRQRSRSSSRHRSRSHSSSRQTSPTSPRRPSLSREHSNSISPERLHDKEIKVKIKGKKSKERETSKGQEINKLHSSSSEKYDKKKECALPKVETVSSPELEGEHSYCSPSKRKKPTNPNTKQASSCSGSATPPSPSVSSAAELHDGKCGARCHSPTESEMRQEIDELEKRIASDKKRLLQLMMKKEQRKHTEDKNGLQISGECLKDLEHTDS